MKKCSRCQKIIDVGVHPYANVYPVARQADPLNNKMRTYHLQCLVEKIREEDREVTA
ncbi:hypothetical protein ACNF42_07825 [Cuniculiplasma sp. SKW3]|uniref:hypothetical protein n=1 Tax=Cuniculiplasma sp. SKW3 TaxID=3400170 RepID=UPI003FD0EFFC